MVTDHRTYHLYVTTVDGLFAPFAHGVDEQIEAGASWYALETHGRWVNGVMKFIGIKQKPPTSPQTNRPKKKNNMFGF